MKITYLHLHDLYVVIEEARHKIEIRCDDGPLAGLRKAADEKRKTANLKMFEAALIEMAIEQIKQEKL